MKIGDKVKIKAAHFTDGDSWPELVGMIGIITGSSSHKEFDWKVSIDNELEYANFNENELELINRRKEVNNQSKVRTFGSGATRDTDKDKLNYIKALDPLVLQTYVEYLGKHRVQSDGNLRDWDNWKKGIDKQTYLESEDRHHRAIWLLSQGYDVYDNHGPVTEKDALCGVIFNAMGRLYELLKAEDK